MIRNLLRGGPDGPRDGVVQHTVGNALVLHAQDSISAEAQSLALTRIGLDLKTVIDQMREQVQNLE